MTIDSWLAALDERHLTNLTSAEVGRALRALSSCYVERRDKLATGGALDGAGKRAAFALFYGPQHFLIVREITLALGLASRLVAHGPALSVPVTRVIDLGCGTGSAGAAVAVETGASIEGFDLNPWAVAEAGWTYRTLGLRARAMVANLRTLTIPASRGALVLAAYSVNELPDADRGPLLTRLLQARDLGAALLVVEPIARRTNRWWDTWVKALTEAGGRHDEWRFQVPLPERQRALARAAGLDVQELTARSLYLAAPGIASRS